MKNIVYTFFSMALCIVFAMSCEKDEIGDFKEKTAVVLTSSNMSSKYNFCNVSIGKYLNFSLSENEQEFKFGDDSVLGNIVILSEPCYSFNFGNTK